ncbi:LodA/GoxA family CTQ-dependent oxidase [Paraburkholderia terrae]
MIDEKPIANTVTYEIHPSIGIARLGNSDSYFIGPEPFRVSENVEWLPRRPVEGEMPDNVSEPFLFRDRERKLKRQAARFRIYKCTRNGEGALCEAEELHFGDQVKSIEWRVHLRNCKGAAARFDPSANAGRPASDGTLRNATTENRSSLVVDPGPRTLRVGANSAIESFDTGTFQGKSVDLGEMRTDSDGRLLVIGGKGESLSVSATPSLDSFTDNDDWCDDTSDGPVSATIVTNDGGEPIDVVPSWVIVAPPDFAPDISSFVTLHDICYQAWMDRNGTALPGEEETNFYRDVLPILRRARGYRWVFAGVMRSEVPDKHGSWSNERSMLFAALAEPSNVAPAPGSVSEKAIRYRQMLFAHLRDPDNAVPPREVAMPRLHDDHKKQSTATGASEVLALTPCQYRHMRNWANGTFTNNRIPVREFECEALDRIALQACSGGPFWPGIEASRIMKDKRIYMAPFRIDPCSELWLTESAQENQPTVDVDCGAGRITKGLAVPWQADFYECRMDGDATWWPATHPDKVLVVRADKNMDWPADALSEQMELWHYGIDSRLDMVKMWSSLGIVKAKQLTKQDGWGIPATAEDVVADGDGTITSGTVYVEDERIDGGSGLAPRAATAYDPVLPGRSSEKRTDRASDNRKRTIRSGSS